MLTNSQLLHDILKCGYFENWIFLEEGQKGGGGEYQQGNVWMSVLSKSRKT